ncbi:antibiotic biosynthesis monooxygenase [Parafrankia sp. BMG5.11]|uniref:globin domain-containing protein n=1 Tax=Parafrankia sp. BMG5.11 TaxID=222540 RepID=UPI00103DE51C|nr:antibiotic biosynthesis monooxygenase [Parafrankia sp. BMG5.11]TCJ40741.1 antibiotic biosynthesis monooxygenase [Parafrankia sp. BMG5.11]
MIVEYIRYRIPEHSTDEFEKAYSRAAAVLEWSRNCLSFELTRCVETNVQYILRIQWDSVAGHLDGFRRSAEFREFLAQIGPYVEHIEEMQHYSPTAVAGRGGGAPEPPTLYEWAGGAEAFERLLTRFYETVVEDDLLAPLFAGMNPAHAHHVAMWLGEVFGGPAEYTEKRGGYENMLAHHVGRAITEPQRRRWVSLLVDAADEVGLPGDPEFRAAFMGYVEWGTRLAVENSTPSATPMPHAPVPRWGWGVAPPWQPS